MTRQDTKPDWEVVVVEDGSQVTSEQVCGKYADRLDIKYLSKPNSGPGASRNFGIESASGGHSGFGLPVAGEVFFHP